MKAAIGSAASRAISRLSAGLRNDDRPFSRHDHARYLPLGYCFLLFLARRSSRGIPGASLPEVYQVASAASKNVELCLSNIGNAYGVRGTRKTTLTIAAVLPKSPVTPWRRRTRLLRIVCNPEPAIRERFPLCRSYSRTIKNLCQTAFAREKHQQHHK